MAKNNFVKSSKNSCPKHCEGLIVDKKRGRYCAHIERKMPKSSRQSVDLVFRKSIENLSSNGTGYSSGQDSVSDVVGTLYELGLNETEVNLILDRYIHNMSYEDIRRDMRWVSSDHAQRSLNQVINKLRKARKR